MPRPYDPETGVAGFAQVYKGFKSGVQPVAIKVLNKLDDCEIAAFAEVRLLPKLATHVPACTVC